MRFIKLIDYKDREVVLNTTVIAAVVPKHNNWSEGAVIQLSRGITLLGQVHESVHVDATTAQEVLAKLDATI
ncbi:MULTISPECIES: hypothetical protein [Pseudomonas]|uniref:Uncharacterized protein n=1 Tax=Pseudomonas fulva TaxID=47880 RepID=A0A0D0KG80_9PSED|nr:MULTISPECIES: hypothetical protein [Pseudomonas]KIP97014.1 hypothetical protein RU08_19345 [Pseudomonas fulva]